MVAQTVTIEHVAGQRASAEAFARLHDPEFAHSHYEELDGYVATASGQTVGVLLAFAIQHPSLKRQVCRIVALAVHPDWHLRGVTERLVHALEEAHGPGTLVYGAFDADHAKPLGRMGYVVGTPGASLPIPEVGIEITPTATAPIMVSHTV